MAPSFDYRDRTMLKSARYRVYATEGNFDGLVPNDLAGHDFVTDTQ